MLAPAIARIIARFGRAPQAVTADRGYGEAKVDAEVEALGVGRVVIPRRGRPGAARQQLQRSRSFTKLVKWRTGSEARISHLKRDWGWSRTRVDGLGATQAWCAWGVWAHNATKVVALLDVRDATAGAVDPPASPPPVSGGSPPPRRRAAPAA